MAPPKTGVTPGKERQAKLLSTLRERGGDKVAVYLPPESVDDMNAIIGSKGFTTRKGRTEAVVYALKVAAKRLK